MSAIDQAFIRAYETTEVAVSSPPQAPAPPANQSAPGPRPHFRTFAPPAAKGPTPITAAPDLPSQTAPTVGVVDRGPTPAAAPSAHSTTARRPLSEFVTPPAAAGAEFRPALEVDAYRYSPVVARLCDHPAAWQKLLPVFDALAEDGRTVIGVAGAEVGSGTSTVAACLARLVARAEKKVALVDGDFVTAGLARELGLAVELGWEDVLAGRVPLAEAAVQSLADGIALLPLAAGGVPASEKIDGVHGSVTAGVLRYHHDFVIVDLGSAGDAVQSGIARRVARQCGIDAVLLVDAGDGAADRLQLPSELADVTLGVIENRIR